MPQPFYTRSWAGSEAPDDSSVRPRFYLEAIENELASQEEGRRIFRNVERVEIFLPGNPYTRPVHNVTDEHRQRWPRQYEAFLQGLEQVAYGIPIGEWPVIRPGTVEELKSLKIQTVEELAALSDVNAQRVHGLIGLREKAKAYLDGAAEMALTEKLSAEGEKQRAEIASLSRQVTELQGLVNQLHADNQSIRNMQHPLATIIPGMHDPAEALRMQQAGDTSRASPTSSIGEFAEVRRRPGRPRKVEPEVEATPSF